MEVSPNKAMSEPVDGVEMINGQSYMRDAKGNLVPLENVKPQHKLEDETVRKIVGFAEELSAQISRFRNHTFADLLSLTALLAQEYDSQKGGKKGNTTFQTVDGCRKVQVQVSDFIDFGPEIQIAKSLIDECLNEWAADSRPEIRSIVTRAFNTDKEGQINKSEIFMLMRLEIEDERWQRAMTALKDAMRITGSKSYVRFYRRDQPDADWQAITIDLAKAA
ncbi:hypothetical protein SIAM614_21435 [Stappia aggregata IAM 12614]|uniref:Sulfate transporter n=1 Tax=Roseibium aggregatum (strain ATCC 25650 / DSM 13394 / JCM 20685 / NBRC 16684 / NCIMB 2208 / IAM 12614 / B1) TaxID=384765 RepID=A0P3I7_ROSAI|nr:DUF3164 family protein [Roseibium aggregatum]EAV40435.1 hypothetical protein SIAM614_21435 [Stappia aggregata IAM 12614] [Roseibium aggregatum IAM 12614]